MIAEIIILLMCLGAVWSAVSAIKSARRKGYRWPLE